MSSTSIDTVVEGLLNGKQPSGEYLYGKKSEQLAKALATRIDAGVAPSLCAHAMCGSSAAGNVSVVRMLSNRPMSTYNKAYNFGEPLRRACRAFVRASDPIRQEALAECARLIVAAGGDLNAPDKYLKSGLSAAGSLAASGSDEALALLQELLNMAENQRGSGGAVKSECELKFNVKVETKQKEASENVKQASKSTVRRKRTSSDVEVTSEAQNNRKVPKRKPM